MNHEPSHRDEHADGGNGKGGTFLYRCMAGLRQWIQPAPFRIAAPIDVPARPDPHQAESPTEASPQAQSGTTNVGLDQVLKMVPAFATALWRVRTKLSGERAIELPAALRLLPRHIESAWDALKAMGIEVQDHVGQRYDPGMAVNPVTHRPEVAILPNTIVEALKPTVFFGDLLIQRADVILAAPLESGDTDNSTPPAVPAVNPPTA